MYSIAKEGLLFIKHSMYWIKVDKVVDTSYVCIKLPIEMFTVNMNIVAGAPYKVCTENKQSTTIRYYLFIILLFHDCLTSNNIHAS